MELVGILDNLETIASAPSGIDHLRHLVLEMAVRGQLIESQESDEPVHTHLERIDEERRILEEGARGSGSASAADGVQDPPFEIPSGWAWARLDSLVYLQMGQSPPSSAYNGAGEGLPFFQGKTDFGALHPTPRSWCTEPTRIAEPGDVLLSVRAPVGPTNIATETCCIGRGLASLRPLAGTPSGYINWALRALETQIASMATGTTFVAVSKRDLAPFPIPVPPLGEQWRIVAKVDELMALCDELEAQQVRLAEGAARSRVSALEALVEADSPEALTLAWKRVAGSGPLFVGDVEGVKLVRKSVLSVGLRSWGPPKTKERNLTDLGDVVAFQNGYAFKSEWYVDSGTRLVRCQNIGHGDLNWSDVKSLPSERYVEFERFALEAGDIVLALDRPLISTGLKVARVATDDLPALLLQRVARLTPDAKRLDPGFLWLWLRSPAFVSEIDPGRSNGVPHISTKELARIPIWLPGLEEQRRICTQLGLVLDLCDRLEGHLQDLAEEREMLSGSAVRAG